MNEGASSCVFCRRGGCRAYKTRKNSWNHWAKDMHIKDRWKVWRHMASLGWKGLKMRKGLNRLHEKLSLRWLRLGLHTFLCLFCTNGIKWTHNCKVCPSAQLISRILMGIFGVLVKGCEAKFYTFNIIIINVYVTGRRITFVTRIFLG
jgi:hypothetical protein